MTDRLRELEWNVVAYVAVAVVALVVLTVLYILVPPLRQRWWPLPRLRRGPWGGHEVFMAFCAHNGFSKLVALILMQIGTFTVLIGPPPDTDAPRHEQALYDYRCVVISSPLGLAVTLGVLFPILFTRIGCRPHHLGLSWARWPANLGVGVLAFVIATPLVLGLHLFVTLTFNDRPHMLAEFGKISIEQWEWFFIAFAAIVSAPLLEEIVFRGVLQGWLWRASLTGHLAIVSATILIALPMSWFEDQEKKTLVFNPGPLICGIVLAGGYLFFMFRLTRQFRLSESEIQDWLPEPTPAPLDASIPWSKPDALRQHEERRLGKWRDTNASLAIYGSAMLFAMFHASAWPAPIALFPFALVLGYLARRSQSLIGPITLHALFNLLAFIALYGSTHYELTLNGNAETTAVRSPITSSVPASQLPLRK